MRAVGLPNWSTARSAEWQPLRHKLVVEVRYEHIADNRFPTGWRPDKAPAQCTFEKLPGAVLTVGPGLCSEQQADAKRHLAKESAKSLGDIYRVSRLGRVVLQLAQRGRNRGMVIGVSLP
jgi:hypothetical protein